MDPSKTLPIALCQICLQPSLIQIRRAEIAQQFIHNSPNIHSNIITGLAPADLRLLFEMYDNMFFDRYFQTRFPGDLQFSLSSRMTRSAGKTLFYQEKSYLQSRALHGEIRMSIDFFLHYHEVGGNKVVCGIPTKSALEAFQLVLEHEICHLIEFTCFLESNCKKNRFKSMARNIFGHTESYHRLPTQHQIAREKYGLKPGDKVNFQFGSSTKTGFIHRIGKRATVMVLDPHGDYRDQTGNRYTKYYVPVELLQ